MFRSDGTTLVRIARKGQSSPDGDGVFADFDHPALNAAGQVAFQATLSGTAHTQGIYLYDDVLGLVPVVRLGDPLLGQTIAGLGFAHDTSRGRSHVGLNASGKVAFRFDLSDGRRGVAVWTVGTGPTTSTTAIGPTVTTSTTATSTTTTPTTTTPTTSVTPTSIPSRQASLQTAKKAKRLYASARRLLGKAGKAATKASRGKHPKLSAECAAGVVDVVQRATGLLNGGLSK